MIITTTERLIIRRFVEADYDRLLALVTDPIVMRYNTDGHGDAAYARARLSEAMADPGPALGTWAVQTSDDPALLGYVSLFREDPAMAEDEVELGYFFLPEHWGKGYAPEAAKALITHAFATTNTTRILAIVDPSNTRSATALKKLGMTRTGTTQAKGIKPGDWVFAVERSSI